jgi:hypothetical protein
MRLRETKASEMTPREASMKSEDDLGQRQEDKDGFFVAPRIV